MTTDILLKNREDIYKNVTPVIDEMSEKPYGCPVCGKSWKKLQTLEKHLEKQNCHSLRDIYDGTVYEQTAYNIYSSVLEFFNPKARTSFNKFKESKSYNSFIRLSSFCTINEIKEIGHYLGWLINTKKVKKIHILISEGLKESNVREFRLFLQKRDLINSSAFFEKYEDDLRDKNDPMFFVRSIEKGHISVKFLMNHAEFDFYERVYELPVGYQLQIIEYAEEIFSNE